MMLFRQPRDHTQTLLRLCLLCLVLATSGCVSTPIQEPVAEPAMQPILRAYRQTVVDAFNDPNENWTSGWTGNMWINFWGSNNYGLCYHWKYRVHAGIKQTVLAQHWALTGIVINRGTSNEHHAVVVYDPARLSANDLLTATRHQPAYVFDPWRQGEADIYYVEDWLKLPARIRTAAALIPITKMQKSE